MDPLLEAEPLASAGVLGLGDALVAFAAFLELDDLTRERFDSLAVCLLVRLPLDVRGLQGADHAGLEVSQWVRPSLRGEQPADRQTLLLAGLGDDLPDLRLHRVAALGPEAGGDLLGQALDRGVGLLGELLADLAEPAAQLRPHVIDVGCRLLAVEDAGADLDRLAYRVRRGLAELLTFADEMRGALVVDGEVLDQDPPVEGAYRAVAAVVEGELWSFGCFHGDSRR